MNLTLMTTPPSNPMNGEWSLLDGDQHATKLLFNARGTLLAVTGKDGRVGIWDFCSLRTMVKVLDPAAPADDQDNAEDQLEQEDIEGLKMVKTAICCAWSVNSRKLFVGYKERGTAGRICVWNVKEGRAEYTRRFDGSVNSISPHPINPNKILVCLLEGNPVVLDMKTNNTRSIQLSADSGEVTSSDVDSNTTPTTKSAKATQTSAVFNKAGNRIYLVNSLGLASIIEADSLKVIHNVIVQGGMTHPSIQLSPDETSVLVPTARGIRLLSTDENSPLEEIRSFVGAGANARMPWTSCGFSPDGTKVFGVASSRYLQVGGKGLYTWTNDSAMIQENIGGLKEGIQTVIWQPEKPCMITCTCIGNVYVLEEIYQSNWPGPMYPPNYVLINDNISYEEPEDEFDIVEKCDTSEKEVTDVEVSIGDASDYLWMQQDNTEELLFLPSVPIANQIVKEEDHFSGSIFRPTIREAAAQRIRKRAKLV